MLSYSYGSLKKQKITHRDDTPTTKAGINVDRGVTKINGRISEG